MKQSRFYSNLTASNSSIKAARAKALETVVGNAQKALISDLESEVSQLELNIDSMLDMAPGHTTSLKFDDADARNSANTFVKNLHQTSVKLELKRQELLIAQGIYNSLFEPQETEEKKSNDSSNE